MKEGYKKISFDISEENYDYIIKMKKNANIKVGAFLNVMLDRFRTNETDIGAITYAIKEQLLDKKIKILEKNIREQSLILQELKDFKTNYKLERKNKIME
ncbi:MAG: hypothetical protein J1E85_03350 [Ruminococcus sp.]|nr:hypothetical protein [Ruminococcus sp.]